MTERNRVLGIDPGPTPGMVRLDFDRYSDGSTKLTGFEVVQCSAGVLWDLLPVLADDALVAVERFVSRGRASAEQRLTADQVASIVTLHPRARLRSASQVKPWATDARLDATASGPGLLKALAGMRHARDAARHALYAAVHDAGLPDPFSKEYRR